MADFLIQRGVSDFGASADALDVTLGTAVDTTRAFVRLTNAVRGSGGVTAGSTATKNVDDVAATVAFIADDEFTITRPSTAENVDYRYTWELWEYVGPAGGPNEFIVRDHVNTGLTSGLTRSVAVTAAADITKVVPIVVGWSTNATIAQISGMAMTATVKTAGTDEVEFERAHESGRPAINAAFVELTGSNWILQQNVTTGLGTAPSVAVTITDVVDWSHAWIEWGYRLTSALNGLIYSTEMAWPHPSNSARFNAGHGQGTGSYIGSEGVAHIIRNDAITVDHYDSVDGGGTAIPTGSSSPQATDLTISTVGTDLAAVSLLFHANSAGTGAAYPRQYASARLKDATTVEVWRGRHGQALEWALSVIRAPTTLVPDPGVMALTAVAITVDIAAPAAITLTPPAVGMTLTAPALAVLIALELTPAPAAMTLSAPALVADVPRTLTPTAAGMTLTAVGVVVSLEAAITLTLAPAVMNATAPNFRGVHKAITIAPGVMTLSAVGLTVDLAATHLTVTPSPASMVLTAPALAVDIEVLLTPAAATMALTAPELTVRLELRLTLTPAVMTLAAPAMVAHRVILLDPATMALEAMILRGANQGVSPAPAVMTLTAPAMLVQFQGLDLGLGVAAMTLRPVPFLLEVAGRPMLEARLGLLELLELPGLIAEQVELEGSVAATLEPTLWISEELESNLAITQTIEEPAL